MEGLCAGAEVGLLWFRLDFIDLVFSCGLVLVLASVFLMAGWMCVLRRLRSFGSLLLVCG